MVHACSTSQDIPRCSTSVEPTLVEHPWNTRGTCCFKSPSSGVPNLSGIRRRSRLLTWKICVRVFQTLGTASKSHSNRFKCIKIVEIHHDLDKEVISSFKTLIAAGHRGFAADAGFLFWLPGRPHRSWNTAGLSRRVAHVPRVFHECSTSVPQTLVEHRGMSRTRGTPGEHAWNTVERQPPQSRRFTR